MLFARVQAAVLSVVLLPSLAAATVQDCVELARTIVYNNSRSYSEEEQRQINKADFCSERYKHDQSASSLQIEASYKVFSGGVEGSVQQIHSEQDKQCGGKYDDSWRKSIKSDDARTASSDALAVVRACLELDSKGLSQKATIADDGHSFTLSVSWNGATPSPIKVNYMGPLSLRGYSCAVQNSVSGLKSVKVPNDTSVTIKSSGSHTLLCERPRPSKSTRDGEEHICYPETLVPILTEGPQVTIKFPRVCTPSMPGKRAEKIEIRIKEAEQKIQVLTGQLNELTTGRENDGKYVKEQIQGLDTAVKAAAKKGVEGLRYHWAGRPENLQECVQIQEPADSTHNVWDDNFLCLKR